jgi:predicted HicB family RNase H-like nuclease
VKTETVKLRISPEDKAEFQVAAKASGMSLSEWLIAVARRWLAGKKGAD